MINELTYWLSYGIVLVWVSVATGFAYLAFTNMKIRTKLSGAFLGLFICFFIIAFKTYDAYFIHHIEIKHYDLFMMAWAAGLSGLYAVYRFIWGSNFYGFR